MAGIHDEHRKRVRKEFLEHGFNENTPEHKILEMLLFYGIPRKDTNELAHYLINKFGSLSKVLEAEPNELMKVDGIGENAASLLKLMLPVARTYYTQKQGKSVRFENMNEICDYLMKKYLGLTKEMFSITSFDSKGNLIGFDFLSSGDVASVGITSRIVIEAVLKRNAVSVILAHNHPGGNALPSIEDINVTEKISNALKHINVRLLDHIIVCSDDYVTLRQSRQYKHLFN